MDTEELVRCPRCLGTGGITCPKCGGSGRRPSRSPIEQIQGITIECPETVPCDYPGCEDGWVVRRIWRRQ